MPEITSVDVFGQKGTFSAGLSIFDNPSSNDFFAEDRFGTYQYALVQVLYENDELIIRVDDGKTFRYPAIYLQPGQQEILKKGTQPLSSINGYIISAVQISNGNWIPVTISKYEKEYRYVYYLWNSDQHYPVIFRRIYDLNIYFDFMQYYGVNDFLGFELQDIAFYNKAAN